MPKRILIIDDDQEDRNFITSALEIILESYDFTCANNGQEALDFIKTVPQFDLIFLDLNMPLMDGYETLEAIKRQQENRLVPVVVISNSKSRFDIDRCKRLGASDYIIKPNTFLDFVDELKRALLLVMFLPAVLT